MHEVFTTLTHLVSSSAAVFSKNLSFFTGIGHSVPHIVEYQEVSWFGLQVLRRAEETVLGG